MSDHPSSSDTMEKIVALCKRRGFIFPSSEIYGGLNGCWDYGPLGTDFKRNIKDHWWRTMTQERDDIVGLDGSILMNRLVWKASGHETTFSDPMVDCKKCKTRYRADQLSTSPCGEKPSKMADQCGAPFTDPRHFNLMFKTYVGPIESDRNITYLRPETAQAIFVQFKNILETSRVKIPFGIAQIGKAFRNEINPRHFTFRSREFEQMEVEFFVHPDEGFEWTDRWLELRLQWYEKIGIPRHKIHVHDIPEQERAFYSKKTYDLEYAFPFGVSELEGIAYRTNYDLSQHQQASGKPLEYFDEVTQKKWLPHVVEPSAGVDRTALALLCEAFHEEKVPNEKGSEDIRTVLRFTPSIAPIKVGIFPLLKNKPDLVEKAKKVQSLLRPYLKTFYDESGAIGRRYRRMDEVGTPFGITIDFETLEGAQEEKKGIALGQKDTVTVRHRDSMKQERIPIDHLLEFLLPHFR